CVALFTLVAHRSCDGRNSDLAVARVEVGVLPGGVFLLLRCFHTHNPNSVSFLTRPHGPNVTTYWGGNARQIVCCCDIWLLSAAELSADQYTSSRGKPHVKALGAMSFFDPDRPRLHCGIPATGHRKVTVDAR